MAFERPTIQYFKDHFVRDFAYQDPLATIEIDKFIQDSDITRAMNEAEFIVNESIFSTQDKFNIGYVYLTAHYLVMDFEASSQGLGGKFNWGEGSKSVGSVSQSFAVPGVVSDNPLLSMLTKTNYGAKYVSLVWGESIGRIKSVGGATLA